MLTPQSSDEQLLSNLLDFCAPQHCTDPIAFMEELRRFLANSIGDVDRVSLAFNVAHGTQLGDIHNRGLTVEHAYSATPAGYVRLGVVCDHVDRAPELPLSTNRNAVDRSLYHEPHVLRIEVDGSYLGRVILWRDRSKPEISEEALQIATILEPVIAFLLKHLVLLLRRQNPQRYSTVNRLASLRSELRLSLREHQVLSLRLLGASNAQIADALSVAATTVRKHLRSIYKKAGTTRVTDLLVRSHGSVAD